MQKVMYKVFFDYQKEEAWINEMAELGLSLLAYSPFRYVFERTEKSKHLFRIELLKYRPSHPESEQYLEFLEENDVKIVATSLRWVFLKKENDGNGFDLINDLNTKILHYKRYLSMVVPLFLINFFAFIINLMLFSSTRQSANVFALSMNFTVSVILGVLFIRFYRKYAKLKREAIVYE